MKRALLLSLAVLIGLNRVGHAGPPAEAGLSVEFDPGLSTGSWSDSVVLDLPPAPRGAAPPVMLVANHNIPDGVIGSGWALVAGGEITRHSSTGGVPNYSPDRYRVDGMDLVSVASPGTTHYQPQTWDGSRFDYNSTTNTWTRKKDGWIWTYGSTTGTGAGATRLLADGVVSLPTSVGGGNGVCFTTLCKTAAWKLSRVQDEFGNTVTYAYAMHALPSDLAAAYPWSSAGDTLLSTITYGSAKLSFVYGRRPDPRFVATDGRTTLRAERLKEIRVTYGVATYASYVLQYQDEGPGDEGALPGPLTDCAGLPVVKDVAPVRSSLRKIVQLATTGGATRTLRCLEVHHEATVWDSDAEAQLLDVIDPPTSGADAAHSTAQPIVAKLDGDGVDDLIVLGIRVGAGGSVVANHRAYVATPNVDRSFAPSGGGGAPGAVALLWESQLATRLDASMLGAHHGYAVVDLDGSSRPELLWEGAGKDVFRDEPTASSFVTTTLDLDGCDLRFGDFGDVNGDGLPDLIIRAHPTANGCAATDRTRWILNTGAAPWLDSAQKRDLDVPLEVAMPPATWAGLFAPPPGGGAPVCPVGVTWPTTANPLWDETSYVADHARFADFNHDGLVDVAYALYGCWKEISGDLPATPFLDNDFDPVLGSEFSQVFFGTGKGTFVATSLAAGPPLTLDTDTWGGSGVSPDRLLGGMLSSLDLDRDGLPELISTDNLASGLRAGATSFRGVLAGWGFDASVGWMDTDYPVGGMGYISPGYDCYQRTATAATGDFDGDGFVDVVTLELDEVGVNPLCEVGQWCAVLRRNHRTTAEGRTVVSVGPSGGRTELVWGFSAQAPNDNPALADNVEVIQRVTGGDGTVALSYSGAIISDGRPTPFARVQRQNQRGQLEELGFVTAPWARGQASYAARYREAGTLEHATIFAYGARYAGAYYFSPSAPFYNPLVRRCDHQLGHNPFAPRTLASLIEDCYAFAGTPVPVAGSNPAAISAQTWVEVDPAWIPVALGASGASVPAGAEDLFADSFGLATRIETSLASATEAWAAYDVQAAPWVDPTPLSFWRWPVPAELAAALPPVEATQAAWSQPVQMGLDGTVVTTFVEDWAHDLLAHKLRSSVEHRDAATTADDRAHTYAFTQPNAIGHWYRLRTDTVTSAAGAQLWRLTRSDFIGFDNARLEERCGTSTTGCRLDRYVFTSAGDVRTHTSPDLGVESWVRAACGLATSYTDEVGRVRTFHLGTACRPTSSTYEGGTTTLTRDGFGRVITVADNPGWGSASTTTTFTYDDTSTAGEDLQYQRPRTTALRASDGRLILTYTDGFGRTTKRVECRNTVATPRPGVSPCVAGSERTVAWNLWARDGSLTVWTEPFRAGELPVTHGVAHDGAGRTIAELEPAHTTSGPAWNQTTFLRSPGLLSVTDPIGREASLRYTTLRRERIRENQVRSVDDLDVRGLIVHQTDEAGRGTTLGYDAHGGLASTTRDAAVPCVDGAGVLRPACTWRHQVDLVDAEGRVVAETMPDGVKVTHTYDVLGRRLSSTVAAVLVEQHSYAAATASTAPQRTSVDRDGAVTVSVYDGFDRPLSRSLLDVTETWSWGATGELAASTDGSGRLSTYEQDVHGDLVALETPAAGRTTFSYDGAGRPLTKTDADGVLQRTAYTYSGRVASVAIGDTWTVVERGYDPAGRMVSGLDHGVRWSAMWDDHDRLSVLQRGTGATSTGLATVTHTYGPGDLLATRTTTTAAGSSYTTRFGYDALGRQREVTPSLAVTGAVWSTDRDIAGRVRFQHEPEGIVAERKYDAWGRLVAAQIPGGWTYAAYTHGAIFDGVEHLTRTARWDDEGAVTGGTEVSYVDALGRDQALVDAAGTTRRTVWGALDRLSSVWSAGTVDVKALDYLVEPDSGRLWLVTGPYRPGETDEPTDEVEFTYTPAGRLQTQRSAGQTTTFTYEHGELATEAWDDQVRTVTRANPAALWPTQIDHVGSGGLVRTWTYQRDALGRVTREDVIGAGAPAVSTARSDFDAFGRPGTESRSVGGVLEVATEWTYDGLGRPTRRSVQSPGDVADTSWSWFDNGQLAEVTTPSGQRIAYAYDLDGGFDGLVDRIYDPSGQHPDYAVVLARNLRGQVTSLRQPVDGTRRERRYDPAGRLVARASGPATGTPVLDWTATYDELGRRQTETFLAEGTGWTDEFEYDGRGRLRSERRGPAETTRTYTWSTDGNLLATEVDTGAGPEETMTAEYVGQVLHAVNGEVLEHDAWQGTTLDQHGNVLTYSADGEVRTLTGLAGTTTLMRDAAGLPVGQDEGQAGVRRITYDLAAEAPPLEVRDGAGVQSTMVYGLGQRLGQVRDDLFANAEVDAVGTLMRLDADVLPASSAFGLDVTPPPADPGARFLFAGLEALPSPGLHLARHRVYDAETGRFVSPDPIGLAGGRHRFAYADGDPVNGVDPMGWSVCHLSTPASLPPLSTQLPERSFAVMTSGISSSFDAEVVHALQGHLALIGMRVDFDLSRRVDCPAGVICDGGPTSGAGADFALGPSGAVRDDELDETVVVTAEASANVDAMWRGDANHRRERRRQRREARRGSTRKDDREFAAEWPDMYATCRAARECRRVRPRGSSEGGHGGVSESGGGPGLDLGLEVGPTGAGYSFESSGSTLVSLDVGLRDGLRSRAPTSLEPSETTPLPITITTHKGSETRYTGLPPDPAIIKPPKPPAPAVRASAGDPDDPNNCNGVDEARCSPEMLVQLRELQKAWAPGLPIDQSADTGYFGGMTVGIGDFSIEVQVDTSRYWPRQGDLIAGTTVIITAKGQSVSYSVKEGFTALLTYEDFSFDFETLSFGIKGGEVAISRHDITFTLSGAKLVCNASGCTGDLSALELQYGIFGVVPNPYSPSIEVGQGVKLGPFKIDLHGGVRLEGILE